MYFGPKTRNVDISSENEELQIAEAICQAKEFSASFLDNDEFFFEPEE